MNIRLCERLVDAALVCAERTAALQNQRNALEWQMPFCGCELWSDPNIHGALLYVNYTV
jgi:hypothetical protein